MSSRSTLLLTMGVDGTDGLALLSREVQAALARCAPEQPLGVWSLTDPPGQNSNVRAAGGNRLRFSWWAVSAGLLPQRNRSVITLHAHLLPVALPFVHRGAELSHFIVGVDAWRPLSRLETSALQKARRVVAISRHSAAEFRRANPWFGDAETLVCHPGLPETGTDSESDDRNYALIVGRMSAEERYKGHDLLLDIWGELRSAYPGAELRIAGDGDDRPRLEEKANRLGLAGAIQFLGRVSSAELDRLYRQCSFFVMPSRHEGFGFVFLEAMRAGKAVIGARGAASEIIEDGVSGFVVDPEDPGAALSAITKLLKDPSARREMGSRGRERFQAFFTREKFEERLRSQFLTS